MDHVILHVTLGPPQNFYIPTLSLHMGVSTFLIVVGNLTSYAGPE